MQKTQKVKLKNGLEIHFLFDKKFTTSSVQMCFKVGWRNDNVNTLGLAHLFEHLVGKRTKKYPEKSEFAKKLEEMGIVSNAHTGPDMTVYFQNQINENTCTSLEMLFEAIYESYFHEDDLEKEKKVVLNEAREYLDNDDSVVWRGIIQNLFPGTSMEKFFFGDEGTMKNISLKEFEDFYNIYRNPKNAILFVAANSTKFKKQVVTCVNNFYKNLDISDKTLSNKKIEPLNDKISEVIPYQKIEKSDRVQANLRMAYRIGKLTKRERVIFGVVNSLLLGGFSGTLIQRLRDDMGLIYWMQMGKNYFAEDIAYIMFATGCAKENVEMVVSKIKEVIEDTRLRLIQSDIDKTIPIKIYQQKQPPTSQDDLSDFIDSVYYNQAYIQNDEHITILKTITVEETVELMEKVFVEKNMSVCVLM